MKTKIFTLAGSVINIGEWNFDFVYPQKEVPNPEFVEVPEKISVENPEFKKQIPNPAFKILEGQPEFLPNDAPEFLEVPNPEFGRIPRTIWVENRDVEPTANNPLPEGVVVSEAEAVTLADGSIVVANPADYQRNRALAYAAAGITQSALSVALWESQVEGRSDKLDAIQAKREEIKALFPKA